MKQRLKRLTAAFVSMCMLLTAAPVTAFAAAGSLYPNAGKVRTSETGYQYKDNSYQTYVLENEYIRTEAYITGGYAAYYARPETAKASNPFESNSPNLNILKVTYYKGETSGEDDYLFAKSIDFNDTNNAIVYQMQTDDGLLTAELTLSLAELNSGYTSEPEDGWKTVIADGELLELPINNNNGLPSYGVVASFRVTNFGGLKSGYDSAVLEWQDYQSNFSRMGHPTSKNKGDVFSSNVTYTEAFTDQGSSQTLKAVDITEGITNADAFSQRFTKPKTSSYLKWLFGGKKGTLLDSKRVTEYITEIYSDSYVYANPFILTGDYFYSENRGSIGGHTGRLPDKVSYQREDDAAVTYTSISFSNSAVCDEELVNVTGYRGLLDGSGETVVTPSDDAQVSPIADKLYVFKTDSGYAVSADKNYGSNPMLTILGTLKICTDNGAEYYEFTKGKAALSGSVTATWGSGGYLRIRSDGTIEQKGVNLNCPKFKFYSPGDDNSLKLSFTDNGINAEIDPKKNKAIINVDIPNVIVNVGSVDMTSDGNIVMEGEIAFKALFGSDNMLSIEKLGYGLKNGEFKCNGVAATGSINTATLIGLELAEINGEINTFKGEERYAFSLELNAFDLFETEAELELKRFNKTGDLMPNKIWFYVNAEPGIPLVPPIVVGSLTGGGGGVDGLADTFNGDFVAIPPIRFKIKATGDYLKLISGSATATVGPLYAQWGVEDIKLAKIAGLLTEYETHIGLTGERRRIGSTTYTGFKANGGMSMKLEVPKGWNIIEAGGSFDVNMFGGFDNWKRPTRVYLSADANGKIYGKVKFPQNWWLVGGKTIASTDLEFALGGDTNFAVRNTTFEGATKEALSHMKFYFGAVKTGKFCGVKYRIFYIAPKTVDYHVAGWFRKLPKWNLRDEIRKSANTMALVDSNGSEVGFVTAEIPFDELRSAQSEAIALYAAPSAVSNVHIDMQSDDPLDTEMMLLITPENGMTEEFKNSLAITDNNGNPFNIIFAEFEDDTDGNQIIKNEDTANAVELDDGDGNPAILVNLGVQSALNSWDISASGAFSASLNFSSGLAGFDATLTDDTIDATVLNPADGAEYVLRVYYGKKILELATEADQTGINDYFAGEFAVTDTDSFKQALETAGTLAPTGNYIVNAYLMEKFEDDFDEDGSVDTAYVTIGSKSLGTIYYANSFQPEAPADVVIKATGNEVLHADWAESANADGYKITIYEINDEGDFVETERGYKYDVAEFSGKSGLSYDSAAKRFSMDMALTATGGEDPLSADKTYAIGVQALRYMTDEAGNRIDSAAVPGEETISDPAFLPKYVPLDLRAEVSFDDGGTFTEADFDSETGMFSFPFNDESVPVIKLYTTDGDNENISFRLFRTDDDSEILYDSSFGGFPLNSFEGALTLRAQAVTSTGDVTTRYITAFLDNCAPVLVFDNSGSFTADPETGAYTVTGRTEPGAVVMLADENGTMIIPSDDGTFSFDGTLDKVTDSTGKVIALNSFVTSAIAVDQTGNSSDDVALMVSGGKPSEAPAELEKMLNTVTVTFDSSGGSEVAPQSVYKFRSAAEPQAPTKTGFNFVRWELNGQAYDFSADVTEDITLTAVWAECTHENNTNKTSCTEETICSVCGGAVPPAGHKDADGNKLCDVCGADMSVAAPVISPKSGTTFSGSLEITITAGESAEIYYTTDGTEPTTASAKYTGAFKISKTTTVSAIAVIDGNLSSVTKAEYTRKTTGSSGGSSGGYVRPTKPEDKETLPMINGSSMSWDDIAKQLEKLPMSGSTVIDMCGLSEVPQAVIKVIADRKLNVEFRLDSVKSRTVNGADITAPAKAYVGMLPGNSTTGGLRGTLGAKLITENSGVPAGVKLYFRSEFAGQFANLYRVENGRNVFVGTVRISQDGSAEFPALSEKADYIVMVGLSDLPGDANGDGVFNALDASAILKAAVGSEKLPNAEVSDVNGDGRTDALDAAAVLKKIVG